MTVLVDGDYQGPVTNTAVISHTSLFGEVVVHAVAYITEDPELRISKRATPDPVGWRDPLAYTIRVTNLGQQATGLIITDVIPAGTTYVAGSATGGGVLVGDHVRWELPVLKPGASRSLGFQVRAGSGGQVLNQTYAVRCAEGVGASGQPLVTRISRRMTYLPLLLRSGP